MQTGLMKTSGVNKIPNSVKLEASTVKENHIFKKYYTSIFWGALLQNE